MEPEAIKWKHMLLLRQGKAREDAPAAISVISKAEIRPVIQILVITLKVLKV